MPGGSEAKRGMTLPRYNEVVRRVVPRPVVATARDALRHYGTTTASARPLPDYMVAGTKKGGTTSIINWLVDHPHVCRMWPSAQKLKSAHYYDINYGKGEDWYRSHFPTDPPAAVTRTRPGPTRSSARPAPTTCSIRRARAGARDGTVDEGDHAAARPRLTRLLQLPRPSRTGNEDLTTFEEQSTPSRSVSRPSTRTGCATTRPTTPSITTTTATWLGAATSSTWRPARHFPSDQLLILRAEDMFTDAGKVWSDVQQFLGLPEVGTVPLDAFNERPPSNPMKPETQRRLVEYYRPYNEALYDALGRDFGWEQKYDA